METQAQAKNEVRMIEGMIAKREMEIGGYRAALNDPREDEDVSGHEVEIKGLRKEITELVIKMNSVKMATEKQSGKTK